MSDEMDPPRLSTLSTGGGSDPERRLAALVAASQKDVGSPQQIAMLEAQLLPLIGPPLTPPVKVAGSAKAASLGGAGAAKLAAAGAVVIAAASAAYLGLHGQRSQETSAPVHATASPVPPAPASPSITAPEAPAPEPPAPAPEVVAPAAPAAPPAASHERAPSEADLVGQAQAAVSGNPARALSLCEQHRRLYPRGVLVQEREVLAIEALQRLGRHSQAVARGERFLKSFPGSAHQSKIAAIVGSR